jgi:transposase
MFCRLKDFRRVATRYDKRARNFLVVSSFFRTLILAERQLDRAQAVVLLI